MEYANPSHSAVDRQVSGTPCKQTFVQSISSVKLLKQNFCCLQSGHVPVSLQVTQVKLDETEGYTALQLGCGSKRDKQLNGRQIGHCKAAGVDNKRKLAEFRVSQDGVLPIGHELSAAHFVPGQFLDIAGMTIGKGFQGVMKRHGFKGQPASHGNSLAHRAPGGIGACQDPGKVWPGKKMPGRMGNKRRTVQSAWLYKV